MASARLAFTAILSLGLAAPAGAQDITDEELLRLFMAQRDAFRAAEESGLGATRGLTLVTIDDVAAPAAQGEIAQGEIAQSEIAAAAEDGGVTIAGSGVTVAGSGETSPLANETTPTQVVFGKLAPEMQVNVRITFEFDSAALQSDQKPKLAQLCNVMKASDISLFRIVGHTDASGAADYNERLSLLRAEEVARYFVDECGIAPGHLEAIGLGERFLFDEVDPRSGDNRRVEFQALS